MPEPQPWKQPTKSPPFRMPIPPTPGHGDEDDDDFVPTRPPEEEETLQ